MVEWSWNTYCGIGIGGSYRYIAGIGLDGLTNGDVSGATAGLTFKFGRF
jgi:hypothetical protein